MCQLSSFLYGCERIDDGYLTLPCCALEELYDLSSCKSREVGTYHRCDSRDERCSNARPLFFGDATTSHQSVDGFTRSAERDGLPVVREGSTRSYFRACPYTQIVGQGLS